MRRLAEMMLNAEPLDTLLSYLEMRSVSEPTQKLYKARLQSFLNWTKFFSVEIRNSTKMDSAVVRYFNMRFLAGHNAHDGEQTRASLGFS